MGLNQFLQAFACFKTVLEMLLLCPAVFQDLENREIESSAWLPILFLGVSALTLEMASKMLLETVLKTVQTLGILGLLLILGLYGPGDALILSGICLTHVSTTSPLLQGSLLRFPHPDFSLTVLLNAEILSSATVASNLFHNLRSRAWGSFPPGEPFKKRVFSMLLLRAVEKEDESSQRSFKAQNNRGRKVFVKKTVPLTFFTLISYGVTLLFGSLFPLPA